MKNLKHHLKHCYAKNGQTMMETLIALTMVIFFLSGVVIVELYAIRNAEFSQKKSTATKLARQQIERARVVKDSAGFTSLNNNCVILPSPCHINSELTPVPGILDDGFDQGLDIQDADGSVCPTGPAGSNTYIIKSTVSWGEDGDNTTKAVVSSCMTDWRR